MAGGATAIHCGEAALRGGLRGAIAWFDRSHNSQVENK
jgi:hypothetical protein